MKPLACYHSIRNVFFLALWHIVHVFSLGMLSHNDRLWECEVYCAILESVSNFIHHSVCNSQYILVLNRRQSTCGLWMDAGGKKKNRSNEQECIWRKDNNYFLHCNVKCLLWILCLYKLTWKGNDDWIVDRGTTCIFWSVRIYGSTCIYRTDFITLFLNSDILCPF